MHRDCFLWRAPFFPLKTQRGLTLWFTGLSGSGKTTLSQLVAAEFRRRGQAVELLDGDAVRRSLCSELGFSRADRDTNVRRIGFVCDLLSRNGIVAIAAAISPYREARAAVRQSIELDGRAFVEVYCQCPVSELKRRDVKGLYAQAFAGTLSHFSGVSDPYEEPLAAEVVLRTDQETVQSSFAVILQFLQERRLIE